MIQYWLLNLFPELATNTADVAQHRVDNDALKAAIDAIRVTL